MNEKHKIWLVTPLGMQKLDNFKFCTLKVSAMCALSCILSFRDQHCTISSTFRPDTTSDGPTKDQTASSSWSLCGNYNSCVRFHVLPHEVKITKPYLYTS